MKRTFDHIRNSLHARLGIEESSGPRSKNPHVFRHLNSHLPWFDQMCEDRMLMGAIRYGENFTGQDKPDYDRIQSAIDRLEQFKKNRRVDLLCDVRNLCTLEAGEGKRLSFESDDDVNHVKEKT